MSAEKDQVVAELDVFSCRTLLGEQTQASTLYQDDLSDLMGTRTSNRGTACL